MHPHGPNGQGTDHHHLFDTPEAAASTELEGEVLIGFVHEATEVLADRCASGGIEVRRVLDLGSGPGVGTCALAERFPGATVVAVDDSATMLERASARAVRLGLADRVETRQIDLATEIDQLGRAELAWASISLHHVGDEQTALLQVHALLGRGGLVALVERDRPSRVVPDAVDLGRPGLWERLDAAWGAWFADMRSDLPGASASADYPDMLTAAGFDVVADEALSLTIDAPLDDQGRRFALKQVAQARRMLESRVEAADLAALDFLLDEHAPDGVMRRDDVQLRATRRLYVGQRR